MHIASNRGLGPPRHIADDDGVRSAIDDSASIRALAELSAAPVTVLARLTMICFDIGRGAVVPAVTNMRLLHASGIARTASLRIGWLTDSRSLSSRLRSIGARDDEYVVVVQQNLRSRLQPVVMRNGVRPGVSSECSVLSRGARCALLDWHLALHSRN